MADAPAPNFTARAARRIGRVVRTAERTPVSLDGEATPPALARETIIMARLLTKPAAGKYTWQEVRRKADGTWVEKVGGRKAETVDDAVAVPRTGTGDADAVYKVGTSTPPVLLRRTPVEQADGSFALRWVIVTSGANLLTVKCTDDLAHAQPTVHVKLWDGTTESGDAFGVTIAYHTTTGDVFDVVADAGRFVQIGFPRQRSQFMVLQAMDAAGTAQSVDWDYPKGH
jgi:hypothetical protein